MMMYCVKCRKKQEDPHSVRITMRNGKPAVKGHCPQCGTGMYKIGYLGWDTWKKGVNTLIDEEKDMGVQLWNKLQELLPGTKTECPIRKRIETQALDPFIKNTLSSYDEYPYNDEALVNPTSA